MKKGLSLILTAALLTVMLMVGGLSALAAGEPKPEDAKSVLDFTYLTKDKVLASADGVLGYQDSAVDNEKLTLSYVTDADKDWLKFVRTTNQPNGLLVDLNKAKSQTPTKGITDWTGASMVWFYMKADDRAVLDFQVQVTEEGGATGYFSSKNADVKYYYQDEYGLVPVTLANDSNDWGHIDLDSYEGWIGVELANFGCGSGHLKDQTLTGNLSNVTGVGFYSELGTVYIRDIRVTGVAKGLEDLNKPSVPADVSPDDAKSVLDISYLPKGQALDASTGAAVYQDQAFDDSKLKLSCVTVDGEDWLKYEYGGWFNGLLVDLNTAKGQTPAKGVTDWTGATMVWFYVDAEDGAILDLELRAVKGEDTGFFTSKNADVKYYYQDEYGLVPVTLANDDNDWGHIALAEGYEGWVGVELANFACGSGHLADQNLSSYLGQVTGVGFYAEKSCLVRDIRVDGIARGLEEGQGGTSSTGSDTSGSGSTGSDTGSGAPQTGVPFALLPAALVLAAGAGLVLLRKSKADAR